MWIVTISDGDVVIDTYGPFFDEQTADNWVALVQDREVEHNLRSEHKHLRETPRQVTYLIHKLAHPYDHSVFHPAVQP